MKRRNQTNKFLKVCIADALLKLMKTKPFESITVTEITNLANVGRATYYRNFKSKEDILIFKLGVLCEEWVEEHNNTFNELREQAASFFKFIYTIKDIVLQLYESELFYVLHNFFYQYFGPTESDEGEEAFMKAFYAFGILGITTEWIKNGMAETPEMIGEFMANRL